MAQDENLARFADALREQGHPELADQAMSYASETGEGAQHVLPAKDVRHVTVRGVPLDIDAHRLRTWKCTELMARTQSESAPDGDRFLAGVELVTFLMGRDGLDRIVDYLGGPELAETDGVMGFVKEALEGLAPKA